MAIVWTKDWSGADDGTVLGGIDLKNIQDDLSDVTDVSAIGVTVQAFDDDLTNLSSPENINSANLVLNGAFDVFTLDPIPDNWVVEEGGTESKDTTDVRIGANSYAILSDADGSASRQMILGTISGTENSYWRGKQVTLTGLVFATSTSNGRIQVDDGITTSETLYHTGTPGWEELSITHTISVTATKLDVVLLIDGNAETAKFDGIRLNHGASKWQFVRHNEDAVFTTSIPTAVPSQETFTSSGTFTAPAGITQVIVTLCGGGGGGGAGSFSSGGAAGGGGGGTIYNFPVTVVPGDDYIVTVGAAGVGGATAGGDGGTGGDSIFDVGGVDLTAPGGDGGDGGNGIGALPLGGVSVNSNADASGSPDPEEIPGAIPIVNSGRGGNGVSGGSPGGAGGASAFGIGGEVNAVPVSGFGGGGGGSEPFNPGPGQNGKDGTPGVVMVGF